MNDTIQFFYNPMSRSRIVHWMLEEVGVPYELKPLDLMKREHKTPDYLKINPIGKVPAIIHRGVVVTECAAICAYLADAFPKAELAPALDDPRRGTYLRWLFFAAGPIEQAQMDHAFPREKPARSTAIGYGTIDEAMAVMDTSFTPGPWILGDQFTAADVYMGSQVGWGLQFKWIEATPARTAYNERCQARPAWRRANEQAGAIQAKMQAAAT